MRFPRHLSAACVLTAIQAFTPSLTYAVVHPFPTPTMDGSKIFNLSSQYGAINNASALGVKCDGVADDTSALQTWANAIVDNSYNYLPPGKCIFRATLALPTATHVAVIGNGTELVYSGSSTLVSLMTVGVSGLGGFCSARGWNFQGIRFESTVSMAASSWALIANDACESSFSVDLGGQLQSGSHNLNEGLWLNGGNQVRLFINSYVQGVGLQVNGDSPSLQFSDLYLSGKITGGTVGASLAGSTGGVTFGAIDILNNGENVRVSRDIIASANNQIFMGADTAIDATSGGSGYGIHVLDAGGANSELIISGASLASAANNCLRFDSAATWKFNMTGGTILACQASGVFFAGASVTANIVGVYVGFNQTYGIDNGGGSTVNKCGILFANNGTANTTGTVGSSC